jgi:hypothetical protein
MLKKLCQPIVIEHGDDNKVTGSWNGLVNISQEYEINALYTPTFRLSYLSINQLDTARLIPTFGWVCLQSPFEEGARGREKEYHEAHSSPDHQSRTPPSLLQAHPTPPLQVLPAPYLNVHLLPNFQSPLCSLSQSQNHDCGIAV